MKRLFKSVLLVLSVAWVLFSGSSASAQQATVLADQSTGLIVRPTPTLFFGNTTNSAAIAAGLGFPAGVVPGSLGGTGVANTGKTITLGGNFTTSGAFATTFTATANTTLTLPVTGTLATLAGAEALTGKTYNGLTITTSNGALTITNLKTLSVSNTLTLAGTDGTTQTFPSTSATIARTDAGQTFTGTQTFASAPTFSSFSTAGLVANNASGVLSTTLTPTLTSLSVSTLKAADGTTAITLTNATGAATFAAGASAVSYTTGNSGTATIGSMSFVSSTNSGISLTGMGTATPVISLYSGGTTRTWTISQITTPTQGFSITDTAEGFSPFFADTSGNVTLGRATGTTTTVLGTTPSTSTTTGALTVAGGAGFVGDIYYGGTLHGSTVTPITTNGSFTLSANGSGKTVVSTASTTQDAPFLVQGSAFYTYININATSATGTFSSGIKSTSGASGAVNVLDIYSSTASGTYAGLALADMARLVGASVSSLVIGTDNTAPVLIFTANTERARFTSTATTLAGNLTVSGTGTSSFAGALTNTGSHTALSATAIPAGGTAGSGLMFSSTANFGVFFGSGAPTLSAAKGSIYLRSDGTTTNDRAYINTNSSTTWTSLTTGS